MQYPYFVPRMNKPITEQYINYYMREPERFNQSQVQLLKQHAAYYQLPFREVAEDEVNFNVFRALRYLGEGWLQGFSTLKIGEQAPVNPWERVAKAVGQAAGYAGFLVPIPGLRGVAKAVAGKSVPLLVSNAVMKKITPTATKYFSSITKKVATEATLGKMGAVNSALKLLKNPVVGDVVEGAARLGIAGATSNWQYGIDAMLHGLAGGMYMEAGDRLIANAMGALIGGASAGLSTQAIARTLTGAMWNGLPSTMRRETTPEQIYQYLIGGFFAYRDRPAAEKQAYKLIQPYLRPTAKLPDTVSGVEGYAEASPAVKKNVADLFDKYIGTSRKRNYLSSVIASIIPEGKDYPDELVDKMYMNIETLEAQKEAIDEEIAKAREEQKNLGEQIVGTEVLQYEEPKVPGQVQTRIFPKDRQEILAGRKNTITRSLPVAKKIGLAEGESSAIVIEGKQFKITNSGIDKAKKFVTYTLEPITVPTPTPTSPSLKLVSIDTANQEIKSAISQKNPVLAVDLTKAERIGLKAGESGVVEVEGKRYKLTATTETPTQMFYKIELLTIPSAGAPPTPETASQRIEAAVDKEVKVEQERASFRSLVDAIKQDMEEYGFPTPSEETVKNIVETYRTVRQRMKEVRQGITRLTQIIPGELYQADGFRTTQLSISTVLVTDGENEFSIAGAGKKEVNPDVILQDDIVAFVPTEGKVSPDIDVIHKITESEATVITPDSYDRGDNPYWKNFEQYMQARGYDDRGTGIWIKTTEASATSDNNLQKEIYRSFVSDIMVKSNIPETNWNQQIANTFKRLLAPEEANDKTVQKITDDFILEIGKNPDKQILLKWIDRNKQHFRENIVDSDYAVLNKYVIMKKYYDYMNDNYYINHEKNGVFKVVPIKFGEVIGNRKVSQLLPKRRPLFNLVKGLEQRTSSPLKTVTWYSNIEKTEAAMPHFYEEFQKLRDGGMLRQMILKMEGGFEDANITDPNTGKKVVNKYIYIGGRNDKGEFNFVVKHPEVDDLSFEQLQQEISKYTGTPLEELKKMHEEDYQRFLKEIIGGKINDAQQKYWRNYYETQYKNTLLYLRDFNQATDFSFIAKEGFIDSSSKINKRFQIIFNQGIGLQPEDFIADPGVADLRNIKVVIADVNYALQAKRALDPTIEESVEDGNVYVSQQFLDALNASAGLPISGRTNKSFIVHSDPEGGMMLGKYLMKVAPKPLQEWMKANGVDMVADDNAIKQIGARRKTKIQIVNGKAVVDGDINTYGIDVNDIKIVLSEISDAAGINHVNSLAKQMLVHLNHSKEIREDIIDNLLVRSAMGNEFKNLKFDKDIEARNEYTDEDLKWIAENIDELSIDRVARILYSGNARVIKTLLKKISNLNDFNDMFDSIEGFSPEDFDTKQSSYKDVISTLVAMKHDVSLGDKYAVRYVSSLFNKYIINRALRPKIGNSVYKVKNRGWAFEDTQIARDEFMLGRNLRNLNIELNNKVYKLGDLWNMVQGKKKIPKDLSLKFLQDFFNHIAVERVPQDNPAGMQILRFRGFMDIDSNEIMIHSTAKEVTGGSDDDGDSYYLWFAGRRDNGEGKGMKLSWLKEMKKNNDMWGGQAVKKYVDPETGKKADEEVFGMMTPEKEKLKQIMSSPALLGAPGTIAKTSIATTYGRNLLATVVNETTALKQAYYAALDNGKPIRVQSKDGVFELTPKAEKEKSVDWAIRKMAVAITKVADPTDFDEVPRFEDPSIHMLFDLFKITKNGKEIEFEDYVREEATGTEKIKPAMRLYLQALAPFRKLNIALGGWNDYFTTKMQVENYNSMYTGASTYFGGAVRVLGGVDWNFDLTNIYGDKLPYVYRALRAISEKEKTGVPNWEQILFEMTRHPIAISNFEEVVQYIEKSGTANQKKFLEDIRRAIRNQKEGKKYQDLEPYAWRDAKNEDVVYVLLGKNFLDKSAHVADELLDLYADLNSMKRTSDLSEEKINKFLEKAKKFLPHESYKGNPLEVYTRIRTKILELIQQDLIDMTTYNALKGIASEVFQKDKAYFRKGFFKDVNDIFRHVNAYKSKISRDAGEVMVPREIADIDEKWYRLSLGDATLQKIYDIFMMGSFQAKLPNSYMRQPITDSNGRVVDYESIDKYVERIYEMRNATNHTGMGLATSVVPFKVKEAFYGIQQTWYDNVAKHMFTPNSNIIPETLISTPVPVPTKEETPAPVKEVIRVPIQVKPGEKLVIVPKNYLELKQKYNEVKIRLKELEDLSNSLDKTLRLAKEQEVISLVEEKKRMFLEQTKLAASAAEYEEYKDFDLENLVSKIRTNLEFYGFTKDADIPIEGLTRYFFHKSMKQMTIQDWKTFGDILDNMRKPTLIQRLFGDKYGQQPWIRKIDYFLFPSAIDKRLLTMPNIKANMVQTVYVDSDGSIKTGWGFAPTSLAGSLQNTIGNILFEGTRQEAQLAGRFSQEIEPYLEQPGINGKRIWEYESILRDQHAAETLSDWYALRGEFGKSNAFADNALFYKMEAEKFRNTYMDVFLKKYKINTGTEIIELTGDEIRERISDIITKYNKDISLIQKGKLDDQNENIFLKKYTTTPEKLFGERISRRVLGKRRLNEILKDIPFFDLEKFRQDMHDLLATGKPFPMQDIGIDGIYRLSQSAAVQREILEADKLTKGSDGEFNNRLSKIVRRHSDDKIPWTGELPYEYYYPHRNEDITQLKKQILPQIQEIVDKFQAIILEEERVNKLLHDMAPTREALDDLTAEQYSKYQELMQERQRIVSEKYELSHQYLFLINRIHSSNENLRIDEHIHEADRIHELSLEEMKTGEARKLAYQDDALLWELAGKKRMFSQERRGIELIDYSRVPEEYVSHNKDVIRTFHKNMAWLLSKQLIVDAEVNNAFGDATDSWVKFFKLYIGDSLGNPTVITRDMLDDPNMKLKHNPYLFFTDSYQSQLLYKLGRMTGLIKVNGEIPEELKKIDYWTLNKISQAEARYEMASLLAHTKSMVANMFGGTQMTAISAGLDNLKKARDMDYIRKTFSPTFKNRNDLKRAVAEEGVIEEYLVNEAGGMNINVTESLKNFFDDYARKLAGDEMLDEVSLKALAQKHHVSDALYSKVSWFMRAPEVELRTDAFMAHYIQFYNLFNGALQGSFDEHGNWRFNPILSRLAKDGVKCTQFLYTAPYRPAIARSAMGKVLTRFQLWTYNSMNTRSMIYEQAKVYGFREGTMQMDKFQRMMAMDLITLALANAFMFSLFDSALPAPWNWLKDLSEWIFGDKKEKQSAFFGTYPYYVAPLQIISPPIIRAFPAMVTSMMSGNWQKFTDYTVWTMFPFGRLARDIHKSYLNPKSFIDRMTGLPFSGMEGFGKEKPEE